MEDISKKEIKSWLNNLIPNKEPNSNDLCDVHIFDNQIDIFSLPISRYTKEDFKIVSEKIIKRLEELKLSDNGIISTSSHTNFAIQGINLIINQTDFYRNGPNLLCYISELCDKLENNNIDCSHYLLLLTECMSDMIRTGTCIQGVENRLFQMAVIMSEDMKINLKIV